MFDTLIQKVIIGITGVAFVALLIFTVMQVLQNIELEITNDNLLIDIENKDNAIMAYEQILKVLPFEVLNTERNKNAEDEINATLNTVNLIDDDTYKL